MRYYHYLDQRLHWLTLLLLPLSGLFYVLTTTRRFFYKMGLLKSVRLPVPVIVVGNITAGGAGKSPLVMELALQLLAKGYRPGIVSRGYGTKHKSVPVLVELESQAWTVGDEPLMLARKTGCPVAVCADRIQAAKLLIDDKKCDVIIADDGLQHYRLTRDIEIIVIDSQRQFGNGFLLPAGPLRELPSRLAKANFIVMNGNSPDIVEPRQTTMLFEVSLLKSLQPYGANAEVTSLSCFKGQTVHAVAGIANPSRFFSLLRAHDIEVIQHDFADHQDYRRHHFTFTDELPVLMTEKDAVKCDKLEINNAWVVEITAVLSNTFIEKFTKMLEITHKKNS